MHKKASDRLVFNHGQQFKYKLVLSHINNVVPEKQTETKTNINTRSNESCALNITAN